MKKSLSMASTQTESELSLVPRSLLAILVVGVLAISVMGCGKTSSSDALASSSGPAINVAPDPATSPVAATSSAAGIADPNVVGAIEDELVDPESVASEGDGQVEESELPDMKVRQRSKVRSGGVLDLTFDDVEFEIEKDADFDRSMLTPEIEAMHGKEVIIRGFVLESYQIKNIKEFVLVRDNQECCFGPGAYIYHNMQVEMVGDARAEYTIRPITIQGTFTIKPFVIDGKCYSVFHVAATKFKK